MDKPLIIVTGASSGIGAGIAKLFSKSGYNIALLARNLAEMEALKLPHAICIATDVTDEKSVINAIKQAENHFGPIDCLINNAGIGKSGDFTELTHEEHEQTVKVNLLGTLNCIEAVLPDMRVRKSGTIINISSVADRNARPLLPTYAATKAAVKSLSESLRVANAKYGIRISNVAPAKIKTPLLIRANLSDENQIIEVEDFAKVVLWIYEQPQTICIRDIVIAPTYYEA
jgi:NADP-dependent 3-hydroxy acid dehydrogenase YdfG